MSSQVTFGIYITVYLNEEGLTTVWECLKWSFETAIAYKIFESIF